MQRPTRRNIVGGTLPVALVGLSGIPVTSWPNSARAADYPGSMQVHVLVPFTPAGATDIVGRAIADGLAAHWGTSTIVDNVPGAGGNLGMDRVAKGPTDGSLLLVMPAGITTNQFIYKSMSFNPEADFIGVSQVAAFPNLLCIRKGLPVKSVAELITYGKANPGKLNCANSGIGTTPHLAGALFAKAAGLTLVHVPYKGSAPAVSDLIAGNVDLFFDNLPSIGQQAKAGNVVGLAVTSPARSPFAPEYPTVAEALPGFDVSAWYGIGVRSGTPDAIVDALEAAVIQTCKREDVRTRMAAGLISVVGSTRGQFSAFLATERKRWGDLIGELQIKQE